MCAQRITLGNIELDVTFKDIKNVHLSVYPPLGRVKVAAPEHMDIDNVRAFAIGKLDWIRDQRVKFQRQKRESPRQYIERESHYVWGKRYLLKVEEVDMPPHIKVKGKKLVMQVRPKTTQAKREDLLAQWYRDELRAQALLMIVKWEPILGVKANKCFIQHMKTMWGSCNHISRNIRLNTQLAKKPPVCVEYIVVHELIHLIEPTHNTRFIELIDQFMPGWREYRNELNRLPVRHEEWTF
ncbi:MAG: DUF45 domain-containing protein [Proteobacteria bacterium]|nr:DUF45 domain-containing protein [Pseudomonadota bacterium]